MTDNSIEIEISAVAQCTCMPRDSGTQLTDFLHVPIRVFTIGGFSGT